jgi:hypothetical protein
MTIVQALETQHEGYHETKRWGSILRNRFNNQDLATMDMCSNLIPLSSRQACMHAAAADETNYVAV